MDTGVQGPSRVWSAGVWMEGVAVKTFHGMGRTLVRSLMALMLGLIGLSSVIAPSLGGRALAAQNSGLVDDTTYVSELSGEEVTWDTPWEVDTDSTFVRTSTETEQLALTGDSGLLYVIWLPAGLDLASARDTLIQSLTGEFDDTVQVDRGDYQGSSGKVSYSLDKVLITTDSGPVELALFTLLVERRNDTFVTLFYSTPDLFADGMTSAQQAVAVDGTGIFRGIDADVMARAVEAAPSLLDEGSSTTRTRTGRDETPEVTEEATEETSTRGRTSRDETPEVTEDATEETTTRGRTGRAETAEVTEDATEETTTRGRTGRDETPEVTEEATEEATTRGRTSTDKKTSDETPTEESRSSRSKGSTSGSGGDYEDAGLIGEGEYESPQYGHTVDFTDAWVINEQSDTPVTSDLDSGTDQIRLARAADPESQNADTYGVISIRFFAAGEDDTPQSVVDYWTSRKFLTSDSMDGATVLLSDATRTEGSVVLVRENDKGVPIIMYFSVTFVDRGKTAVVSEFYATDTSVADAYADVADGITVDGSQIMTLFDDRDIEDALAEQ